MLRYILPLSAILVWMACSQSEKREKEMSWSAQTIIELNGWNDPIDGPWRMRVSGDTLQYEYMEGSSHQYMMRLLSKKQRKELSKELKRCKVHKIKVKEGRTTHTDRVLSVNVVDGDQSIDCEENEKQIFTDKSRKRFMRLYAHLTSLLVGPNGESSSAFAMNR